MTIKKIKKKKKNLIAKETNSTFLQSVCVGLYVKKETHMRFDAGSSTGTVLGTGTTTSFTSSSTTANRQWERPPWPLSHALSASAKKKSDAYFALSPSDEGLFSATEEPYLVGKTLSLYFHTYIHY